jgi:membrane protease subunit (stomatin/prohibitin family)
MDRLRNELVDIIEWIDDPQTTLVWRFPRYRNEIKHGAKLIVRPGQMAVLVNEGRIADQFQPGTHTLETKNLPILRTILSWPYGFESPFKAEVYFVSTRQLTGLKWGTPNPIMMRDADFGPIRLRAFGTYNLQCTDPKALLEQLVGTDGQFETDEVSELVRSVVVSSFADVLGSSNIAALDLAANYQEIGGAVREKAAEVLAREYGLDMPQFFVVNVSLPEQVEKALDTRSSIGVIGDMTRFQQYQMGEAMRAAAENPSGGGASEGIGLGAGFAMAQAMANQMMQRQAAGPAAGPAVGSVTAPPMMSAGGPPPPPPVTPAVAWYVAAEGRTLGPFSLAQLGELVAQNQLQRDSLVWRAGFAAWTAGSEVGEVAALFGPPPPPSA